MWYYITSFLLQTVQSLAPLIGQSEDMTNAQRKMPGGTIQIHELSPAELNM